MLFLSSSSHKTLYICRKMVTVSDEKLLSRRCVHSARHITILSYYYLAISRTGELIADYPPYTRDVMQITEPSRQTAPSAKLEASVSHSRAHSLYSNTSLLIPTRLHTRAIVSNSFILCNFRALVHKSSCRIHYTAVLFINYRRCR